MENLVWRRNFYYEARERHVDGVDVLPDLLPERWAVDSRD